MTRHPIIVVEGADASGKTTLCRELCRVAGAKYLHLTYRFKDRMDLYHRAALELALRWSQTQPVVLDRWWPSELVYGDEFRGGRNFYPSDRGLDAVAARYGVTYVFCLPSDREAHARRHSSRRDEGGEMYDRLGTLPQRYEGLFTRRGGGDEYYETYDVDRVPLERVGEAAQAIFEGACDRVAGLPEWAVSPDDRWFSGSDLARVALVGELGYFYHNSRDWPLCWGDRCGAFYGELDRLGVPARNVMVIDPELGPGGDPVDPEVLREVLSGMRAVVTYGQSGQELCDHLGLDPDASLGFTQRRLEHLPLLANLVGVTYRSK